MPLSEPHKGPECDKACTAGDSPYTALCVVQQAEFEKLKPRDIGRPRAPARGAVDASVVMSEPLAERISLASYSHL